MGKALEIIGGFVTAPSTTITALTMNTGNSNVVRNAEEGSDIRMIAAFNTNQTAGLLRVRSPFLHDNVNGFETGAPATDVFNHLGDGVFLKLTTQDALGLGLSGSATGSDIELAHFINYYDDLPGIAANLIDKSELLDRMESIMAVQNTLALGTAGNWSGEEAINAEQDQMKANRDYALIGYQVSARCGAVRWRGSDTGNLGVGGPGSITHRDRTRSWFIMLSEMTGLQTIPVFNSANKAAILVDGTQDENGTDTTVSSIFALLKP